MDKELIAYHELGHAIVAYHFGVRFSFVTVNVDGNDCATTFSQEGRKVLEDDPVINVLCRLAGPAGEMAAARSKIRRFEFTPNSQFKWQRGWNKDRCQALEVVPVLEQKLNTIVLALAGLLKDVLIEVGADLVPLLLKRKTSVPASEVYEIFGRHPSAWARLDLRPLAQRLRNCLRGD